MFNTIIIKSIKSIKATCNCQTVWLKIDENTSLLLFCIKIWRDFAYVSTRFHTVTAENKKNSTWIKSTNSTYEACQEAGIIGVGIYTNKWKDVKFAWTVPWMH